MSHYPKILSRPSPTRQPPPHCTHCLAPHASLHLPAFARTDADSLRPSPPRRAISSRPSRSGAAGQWPRRVRVPAVRLTSGSVRTAILLSPPPSVPARLSSLPPAASSSALPGADLARTAALAPTPSLSGVDLVAELRLELWQRRPYSAHCGAPSSPAANAASSSSSSPPPHSPVCCRRILATPCAVASSAGGSVRSGARAWRRWRPWPARARAGAAAEQRRGAVAGRRGHASPPLLHPPARPARAATCAPRVGPIGGLVLGYFFLWGHVLRGGTPSALSPPSPQHI